jgi:hypothetical protein
MTPSLPRTSAIAIVIAVGALTACRDGGGAASPLFELDCDSSDTAKASHLFCVRTDTRNGEILRVNPLQLPTTSGSTAVAAGGPGRFTTVCDATVTDTHSDFYCIRLNTETGELVLINLQKVDIVPATK